MNDGELAGVGVLVTRPRHQASELVAAIAARGGTPIEFPVIGIQPRAEADVGADVAGMHEPDIAIYVSANAVQHGRAAAGAARIAAIGPATAAALQAAGLSVDIRSPAGYNSEHLLGVPELHDVSGKVVRIIRGERGRELLAETLRSRGASVEYLTVYSRQLPRYSDADIANLEQQWRSGSIHVVTVMSVESLQNLVALLPETCLSLFVETPLVTPAARVIQEARERFPGLAVMLAQGPQAGDMVDAVMACVQT